MAAKLYKAKKEGVSNILFIFIDICYFPIEI